MPKDISCQIIQDLLPLYVDGAASEDTKALVEQHLKDCPDCRTQAEQMGEKLAFPVSVKVSVNDAQLLQKFKRGLRNKKLLAALISVAVTAALFIGGYTLLFIPTWAIPMDPSLISVEQQDGELYARYDGEAYYGSVAFNPTTVEIDGEDRTVAGFYLTENLWSRYLEPLFSDSDSQEQGFRIYLAQAEGVDQVYYGEFNLNSEQGFPIVNQELLEQMTLIWEE